jgi:Sensors of blue-light using FAD
MYALSYTSSATHRPATQELEALLIDAREFNASVTVTGALLIWDQSFFEYFEGPQNAVDEVYERIKRSRLHRDIIQLLYEPIDTRYFNQWYMGFAVAPRSGVLGLANDQWEHAANEADSDVAEQPAGVVILLQFWRNSRRMP